MPQGHLQSAVQRESILKGSFKETGGSCVQDLPQVMNGSQANSLAPESLGAPKLPGEWGVLVCGLCGEAPGKIPERLEGLVRGQHEENFSACFKMV